MYFIKQEIFRMRNFFLVIVYLVMLVLGFLPTVTLCMEDVEKKSHPPAKVFKVFLKNQSKYLSHEIIYALALVNKSCEKFLFDTAPQRREYLLPKAKQYDPSFELGKGGPFPGYLNKYGSCACVKGGRESLLLSQYFLVEDEIKNIYGIWNNFSKHVTSLPRPFLDTRGDLCSYGWGNRDVPFFGKSQHLIRYHLSPDGEQRFYRCAIGFLGRDRYEHYALSYFAALPNLLKAFVNCIQDPENDPYCWTAAELKDAIIPDNYAERQDCGIASLNMRFDDLPKILKDAIVARYQECKKTILQST